MQSRTRREKYEKLLEHPNVQKALRSIQAAEGTLAYSNPYSVGFGGRAIQNLDRHPGVSAPFKDQSGNRKRTTAAGAYQYLDRTWNDISKSLGLNSFSKRNQDIAAVGLIDRAGALGNVLAGDVRGFSNKVKGTWASFPNSPYNQPTKSMAFIENAWGSAPTPAVPDIRNVPTPATRPYSAPLTSVERAALSAPQGKAMPTFDQGRFGTPTFDNSRFGTAVPQLSGTDQLRRGLLDQQLDYGVLPSLQYEQTPVATAYTDPAVSVQSPNAAQALGGMGGGGLLGAPAISDRQYEIAAQTTKDLRNRGLLGGFGGALLGGALLGPVGGLIGGYAGRSLAQKSYFPEAPEKIGNARNDSKGGYDGLSDYGKDAYKESKQVRDAVNSGRSGLW